MNKQLIIRGALAGLVAAGLAAGAAQAKPPKKVTQFEKCAGVVKGSQNDCATSMSSCHGSVATDAHPEAWLYVPKGTCEKIVGGRITLVKAPDEK
jgi:uncharacterized membrane protein